MIYNIIFYKMSTFRTFKTSKMINITIISVAIALILGFFIYIY
jgi:hypothetical protein